jgi:hypothetical protein
MGTGKSAILADRDTGTGTMEFGSKFEQTASGELICFARFYQGLCREDALPQREDFRPSDVPWIVGRLYIADVIDGGADYRYRLFGTHLQAVFGADLSGKRLSDLELAGRLADTRADFDEVAATRRPVFRTGLLVWPNRQTIGFERVMVPLAGPDGAVSLILGAVRGDKSVEDLMLLKGFGLPHVVLDSPAAAQQARHKGYAALTP